MQKKWMKRKKKENNLLKQSHNVIHGDALSTLQLLPSGSIHCAITSPPYYGLRNYGVAGQIGAEPTPQEYVARLTEIFRELRRVLRDDGTFWLNLGDSYTSGNRTRRAPDKKNPIRAMSYRAPTPSGLKEKDLIGIPWHVAFALQEDGWYLRSDIIWHKPNAMPESIKDRPTKAHEYVFLLTKSPRYFYNADAVKEPEVCGRKRGPALHPCKDTNGNSGLSRRESTGFRNRRTVWTINTRPFKGAHFAVFPEDLVEPCLLAGYPVDGIVLDPLCSSGTVGVVAKKHDRSFIGVDLNADYCQMAKQRIEKKL